MNDLNVLSAGTKFDRITRSRQGGDNLLSARS